MTAAFTPVKSKNIAGVAYDPATQTLSLKFHDESIYDYSPVPAGVHTEFMQSESKGSFFHSRIRTHYKNVKQEKPKK